MNSMYCRLHTSTVNTIQVRESWVFVRFFAVLHEDATPGFLVHYERVNGNLLFLHLHLEIAFLQITMFSNTHLLIILHSKSLKKCPEKFQIDSQIKF